MCWFHMLKASEDNSVKLPPQIRGELLADIHILHQAINEVVFDVAVEHFFLKWSARDDVPFLQEYLEYFKKEWVVAHKGKPFIYV